VDAQPDNIMMGKMGTIKLGDFGISRQLSSATTHTMHGGRSSISL
jgi:serine/threonine protein kinase